jgi:UvrA interaction domain/UvrA DNA-binding domain
VIGVPEAFTGTDVDEGEGADAGDDDGRLPLGDGNGGASFRRERASGPDAVTVTIDSLVKRGFRRLLVAGRAVTVDDLDRAALAGRTLLQVVVDRVAVEGDVRARLTDSIETAYREGGGAAFAVQVPTADGDTAVVHVFSERFECRRCGITYEDPQPRLFSFNNPFGACATCHGFGNVIELDMELVVPDTTRSIRQGAIEPWTKPHYRSHLTGLKRVAEPHGGAASARHRGRRRGVRGYPRFLRLARAKEVQGARPGVPEPVSGIPHMPGVRRYTVAT